MINKIFTLFVTLLLIITKSYGQYCTNDTRYTELAFFDTSEITIQKDILYGNALDRFGNPENLLMDLYYPRLTIDTSSKRPFIMLVHGGGFQGGDKGGGDLAYLALLLAQRGYVCASINYRLGWDATNSYNQYIARYRAIQDGHAAMRYIVNKADTYRIDTNWLFVGGQSAGAYLTMGMVYADVDELDSVSLQYNPSSSISSELGGLFTSGNTLTNTYAIKGIFNNWGAIPSNEIDLEEMTPTIAFHGELDATARIDEQDLEFTTMNGSRKIHNNLVANNVCSELTVDPTGGHGVYRNELSVFRAQRASCFFKSIFCNSCSDFYATETIQSNCSSNVTSDGYHYEPNIIKVYPNPFENSFSIQGIEGELDVKIYNLYGLLVYEGEILNGHVEVNLLPGLYIGNIRHIASNKLFAIKLTKN